MPSLLRSPVAALCWEILRENRVNFGVMLGLLVPAWLLKQVELSASENNAMEVISVLLSMSAFMILFLIFTRTESNARRDRKGFPARLFALPASTLTLVSVPLVLGVVVAELFFATVWFLDLLPTLPINPLWAAFKLASWMLTYQMLLWCTAGLGAFRMLLIGVVGFGFIILEQSQSSIVLLAIWSVAAFILSGIGVARQRQGGSLGRTGLTVLFDRIMKYLPARSAPFASARDAQLWYEWRRTGFLLPLLVCQLLVLFIAPLSLTLDNPDRALTLLVITLLLPVLLAAPLGKAFAKADTSTADMAVPAFLAVRPLSDLDVVAGKMRAAAISTVSAWVPVLVFVALWQFGWADTSALRSFGSILWAMQQHSLLPQIAIAVLLMILLMLLTWRFLVAGLWIGLSGNGKLYGITTIPIVLVPTVGLLLLDEFFGWLMDDPARLPRFVWCVGALVALRFWVAAWTWRGISPAFSRRYLYAWVCGTACMVALAWLLAEPVGLLFNLDLWFARTLALLAALMVLPLAQLGLAPSSFAGNRHR